MGARLASPGVALLPLRAFLGVTFCYAGASKLLDPAYLDTASPVGVRAQMLQVVGSSPIGELVRLSADHPTPTGLAIAFGELAVGLGALLGLFTRLAALGGVLLSLSFFLTVSWTTDPYYYGPDIGYAVAWTPLLLAGDGGVLSLTQLLRTRARRELGPPLPAPSPAGAPTFDPPEETGMTTTKDVERRTVLRGGLIGTAIGAVVVGAGTVVAFARRSSGSGSAGTAAVAASPSAPAASSAAAPSAAASSSSSAGAGAAAGPIAAVAEVPVGGSKAFTAPGGGPAVLLHPTEGEFVALHAACTHKGCPVAFSGGSFHCPCHGATFSATGAVTGGPAKAPLAPIPVTVADGQVTIA